MKILLQNNLGQTKECPIGFSWTVLLFNGFVPLIRGDVLWSIILFLATLFSGGWSIFIFPFIYNRIYIGSLLNKGFMPVNEETMQFLIMKGYLTVTKPDETTEESKEE